MTWHVLSSVCFFPDEAVYLSMDRTNWKWGRANINILMLSVVYKGVAIPLLWKALNKQGNSNTQERIDLMNRYQELFGVSSIRALLCDREFVGQDWFQYLLADSIPFYIRIKQNYLSTTSRGLETTVEALFYHLQASQSERLVGRRKVWGHWAYLTGLRLSSGELLVIASNEEGEDPLSVYGLRWEVESLFACLKGRGFRFESTHITDLKRIEKLTAVLALTFAWSHKVGDWYNEQVKPIARKKHGRLSMSYFRYGLDWLREALCGDRVNLRTMKRCLKVLCGPPTIRLCSDHPLGGH